MSQEEKKNIAHSISQRLYNLAKANKADFSLLLSRYGMERFLYRLTVSPHADRFILKGASLFLVWKGQNYRVTRDADLLGSGDPDVEKLADIFREVCRIECPQDGIIYSPESLRVESIREEQEYDGVRVTLTGLLNRSRIPLQIDIGFGDIVTPSPDFIEYPVLLDAPAPRMNAYSKDTLIAEKLEAMVRLGLVNSRMKDFFDIWLLSRLFDFEGRILGLAISNTFKRRRTSFPQRTLFAFTSDFYENAQKKQQWKAFLDKSKPDVFVGELASVIADVSGFIMPVLEGMTGNNTFDKTWSHEKNGWTETSYS